MTITNCLGVLHKQIYPDINQGVQIVQNIPLSLQKKFGIPCRNVIIRWTGSEYEATTFNNQCAERMHRAGGRKYHGNDVELWVRKINNLSIGMYNR